MKKLILISALALVSCGQESYPEDHKSEETKQPDMALTFPVPVPPIEVDLPPVGEIDTPPVVIPPVVVPPVIVDVDDQADNKRCDRREYAERLLKHANWKKYKKDGGGRGLTVCWKQKHWFFFRWYESKQCIGD